MQTVIDSGIVASIGCDGTKSSTEPENNNDYSNDIKNIFPAEIGHSYLYSIDTLNKANGSYHSIGTRNMSVESAYNEDNIEHFVCYELHNIQNVQSEGESKFKVTTNSLEFCADTSGTLSLIPDSIRSEVKLELNEYVKIINYPYENGNEWIAYKAVAKFGTINFNVYSIIWKYIGSENLQLEGFSNDIITEKFSYTVKLNIPDIYNPFISNIQ